ncbi:MAG: hypothetical protein D4R38_00725 [Dehalococcoidia bacterium]|nr:MAG: hypothetical protein D4R38_00725 [Dehalococcoidia bacterium]
MLSEELKGQEKMYRQLTHLTKFYISIFIVLVSLLSCVQPQDQAPVIHEMLYPAEVPASFDTVLICRVANPGNDELRFQWSSENGTLRGEGESITWTAPTIYGTYDIYVKAVNASGKEALRQASVNVVPFYLTQVDPDPEINLKLPVIGSGMVGEQSLVGPLTTAEISCDAPVSNINNYKYAWSCNGGKIQGTGLKEGIASKIGWVSPGVPGNYTVMVNAIDKWGNITVGSVYFQVKNPACCAPQDTGGLYQWKK